MIGRTKDISQIRWFNCENGSGEEIPAYAALVPDIGSLGTSTVFGVTKPTRDGQYVALNGPGVIPAGGRGLCTFEVPNFAAYKETNSTPNSGYELWGAKAGEWKLHRGYSGFLVHAAGLNIATGTEGVRMVERRREYRYARASNTGVSPSGLIVWDTEDVDTGGFFTAGANNIAVANAGLYQFHYKATASATTGANGGYIHVWIGQVSGGITDTQVANSTTYVNSVNISSTVYLEASGIYHYTLVGNTAIGVYVSAVGLSALNLGFGPSHHTFSVTQLA